MATSAAVLEVGRAVAAAVPHCSIMGRGETEGGQQWQPLRIMSWWLL